jgi:hypothetical protein
MVFLVFLVLVELRGQVESLVQTELRVSLEPQENLVQMEQVVKVVRQVRAEQVEHRVHRVQTVLVV